MTVEQLKLAVMEMHDQLIGLEQEIRDDDVLLQGLRSEMGQDVAAVRVGTKKAVDKKLQHKVSTARAELESKEEALRTLYGQKLELIRDLHAAERKKAEQAKVSGRGEIELLQAQLQDLHDEMEETKRLLGRAMGHSIAPIPTPSVGRKLEAKTWDGIAAHVQHGTTSFIGLGELEKAAAQWEQLVSDQRKEGMLPTKVIVVTNDDGEVVSVSGQWMSVKDAQAV